MLHVMWWRSTPHRFHTSTTARQRLTFRSNVFLRRPSPHWTTRSLWRRLSLTPLIVHSSSWIYAPVTSIGFGSTYTTYIIIFTPSTTNIGCWRGCPPFRKVASHKSVPLLTLLHPGPPVNPVNGPSLVLVEELVAPFPPFVGETAPEVVLVVVVVVDELPFEVPVTDAGTGVVPGFPQPAVAVPLPDARVVSPPPNKRHTVEIPQFHQFRGMVGKCNTNDGDDCREWQREPAPPPTTTPLGFVKLFSLPVLKDKALSQLKLDGK
ncbi:hypothetical protein AGLY_007628, partial [Aphis glycines]